MLRVFAKTSFTHILMWDLVDRDLHHNPKGYKELLPFGNVSNASVPGIVGCGPYRRTSRAGIP